MEKIQLNQLDRLAKLLATENLLVEHRYVDTAYFDTQTRVLTLPQWKDMGQCLYHMLVLHEIGHALYTPQEGWSEMIRTKPHLKGFVNVIEDARIERLVKIKYPGSRRDFREGYFELEQNNFFGIKDKPLGALSLIDRINLHFKAGTILNIPFSDEERPLLAMVEACSSFEDCVSLAEKLYSRATDDNNAGEQQRQSVVDESQSQSLGMQSQESSEASDSQEGAENQDQSQADASSDSEAASDDSQEAGENQDQSQADASDDSDAAEGKADQPNELEVTTQERLDATMGEKLVKARVFGEGETLYVDIDKNIPVNDFVIGYKEVLQSFTMPFSSMTLSTEALSRNAPAVNYLVKEFETRKAADRYSRSRESKTGVINPTKLHAYSYSDDVFRRLTVTPDSKNHGMLMFVDFSGSMTLSMLQTITQLTGLVSFCRKVGIPHRVYAFTSAATKYDSYKIPQKINEVRSRIPFGTACMMTPSYEMSLIELFNDRMTTLEYKTMLEGLYLRFKSGKPVSKYFGLGHTPLDCAILLARQIARDFKKSTRSQIVSCVFLTDGDSSGAHMVQRPDSAASAWGKKVIRDPMSGYMVRLEAANDRWETTEVLLNFLRRDGFKAIGFRIAKTGGARVFLKWNQEWIKKYRENGAVTVFDHRGYDNATVFVPNRGDSDLRTDPYEKIDSKMTKGQKAKAFIQAQTEKFASNLILTNLAKTFAG